MRVLGSFDVVVRTFGLAALVMAIAPAWGAHAQPRLAPGLEEELSLDPPDVRLLPPPPLAPPPRYDLRARADVLRASPSLAGGSARLLFEFPGGFRVWVERSLRLGPSAGLAPTPGSIDPRAATERYQLRIDSPRGWSMLAELAIHDPRAAHGQRLRSYFVGLMAPPRRRVRMGFGAWGGEGMRSFGFVLRW